MVSGCYVLQIYKKVFGEDFTKTQDAMRRMQSIIYLLRCDWVPVGEYGFRLLSGGVWSNGLSDDAIQSLAYEQEDIRFVDEYDKRLDLFHRLVCEVDRGEYTITRWVDCLSAACYLKRNILPYKTTEQETVDELQKRYPRFSDIEANKRAVNALKCLTIIDFRKSEVSKVFWKCCICGYESDKNTACPICGADKMNLQFRDWLQ